MKNSRDSLEDQLRRLGIIEVTPDGGFFHDFFHGVWEGFKAVVPPMLFIISAVAVLFYVQQTKNLAFLNILWIHFIALCWCIGDIIK